MHLSGQKNRPWQPPWQAKLQAQDRGNLPAVTASVLAIFLLIAWAQVARWMWPEISCLIGCTTTVGEITGARTSPDDRDVLYRFIVDGQTFEGRGLGAPPYPPVGEAVEVRYRPSDPRVSVLGDPLQTVARVTALLAVWSVAAVVIISVGTWMHARQA